VSVTQGHGKSGNAKNLGGKSLFGGADENVPSTRLIPIEEGVTKGLPAKRGTLQVRLQAPSQGNQWAQGLVKSKKKKLCLISKGSTLLYQSGRTTRRGATYLGGAENTAKGDQSW